MLNSKERFTDRVDHYRKYRPGYPAGLIDVMKEVCDFNIGSVVADVGSGTGIMTELLLPHCRKVYAVEPNANMRIAAEQQYSSDPKFVSIDGSAEGTTLSSNSIDLIISAQAFHWFDRSLSKREFQRILKPNGWVVLVWNTRVIDGDSFHIELEEFLRRETPEYGKIHHKNIDIKTLAEFFSQKSIMFKELPNQQILDWDGLKGRFLSASYIPAPGQPDHEFIVDGLKKIFLKHQSNGTVTLKYVTEMYASRFGAT